MGKVEGIDLEAGFITISSNSGPPTRYPIADVLRAADIPIGLTHEQVDGLRILSNLTVIILRTLIEREILDESFVDTLGMDWDLDHIIYAIEQLGGYYHEPNLDNVEEA